MTGNFVIAVDVGGTTLRVALVKPDGSVHSKKSIATPQDDPGALTRMIRLAIERAEGTVAGAVVGMPGTIDYAAGEVLTLPNLPNWVGHISIARLSGELGVSVQLANDADLAALGEHRFGAGIGTKDMVYVTSSTGVGAGIIVGGRLLHGKLSLAEVGHTIIDRATHGTVESLGSGTALERLAGEPAASVAARARSGDADAVRLFSSVAGDLAVGVFNLVHCFSPELVVIGGGMSQAGDLLLDPVREMLAQCMDRCPARGVRVVRARGGDDSGLRGAAAYWADSGGG